MLTFQICNIISALIPHSGGKFVVNSKMFSILAAAVFITFHDFAFADAGASSMTVTGTMAFINSFSIILRESLEAVLIIAAMISALSAMGAKKCVRLVHFGWLGAIAAGLATWWLSVTVIRISGAQAEMIEGVTSLLAAAVLFYVSYWLISKIEVRKWKKYIDAKMKEALGAGNKMAIVTVAFLAVYREAFETVLFYQALLFNAEASKGLILWGLVAGVALVVVLSLAIFKFSLRLSVKYMFSITGLFLYVLSFTLVGKGVHELQEAGAVSETVAGFVPHFSILGIYPTYESFLPQAIVAAALVLAVVKISSVARGGANT